MSNPIPVVDPATRLRADSATTDSHLIIEVGAATVAIRQGGKLIGRVLRKGTTRISLNLANPAPVASLPTDLSVVHDG